MLEITLGGQAGIALIEQNAVFIVNRAGEAHAGPHKVEFYILHKNTSIVSLFKSTHKTKHLFLLHLDKVSVILKLSDKKTFYFRRNFLLLRGQ